MSPREALLNVLATAKLVWINDHGGYHHKETIMVRCENGHTEKRSVRMLRLKGYWVKMGKYREIGCEQCRRMITSEQIQAFAESKGVKITDIEHHKNEDSVLTYQCLKSGHVWSKKLSLFKYHYRCPKCLSYRNWYDTTKLLLPTGVNLVHQVNSNTAAVMMNGVLNNYSINDLIVLFGLNLFEMYGLTMLTSPERSGKRASREKFLVRCPEGHEFSTARRYLLEGHGCKACAFSGLNKPEAELKQFLESLGCEVSTRVFIDSPSGKLEVDLFLPELNVAIEYTGIFWHSVEQKTKMYSARDKPKENIQRKVSEFITQHQRKMILCAETGVHLVHIFESDFRDNKTQMLKLLASIVDGKELSTTDLRYRRYRDGMIISAPRAHFFNAKGETLPSASGAAHTVYDCGVLY